MTPLVFQTDFGLVDGAVSAMYGVAYSVMPTTGTILSDADSAKRKIYVILHHNQIHRACIMILDHGRNAVAREVHKSLRQLQYEFGTGKTADITETVARLSIESNCFLNSDIYNALKEAKTTEKTEANAGLRTTVCG